MILEYQEKITSERNWSTEKATDLPQVTDIKLYWVHWLQSSSQALVVMGTNWIGTCTCKSSYHTIMAM